MTQARSIHQFEDIRTVLDAALNHRGGRYRLNSYGEAVHWRQRAYRFRQLLRQQKLEASLIPGFDPGTQYDKLTLFIPKKGEPDDNIVKIGFIEPRGTFEPNETTASAPVGEISSAPEITLDLDTEISDLKKKLHLDTE